MEGELLPAYGRLIDALEQSAATTREIARLLREAEERAAALFRDRQGVGRHTGHSAPERQERSPGKKGGQPGVVIEDIRQTELSIFFSTYEDSPWPFQIPDEVKQKYLLDPELMNVQREAIEFLANRVQNGEAPLTPDQFYRICRLYTSRCV